MGDLIVQENGSGGNGRIGNTVSIQQGVKITVQFDTAGQTQRKSNAEKNNAVFSQQGARVFDVLPGQPLITDNSVPQGGFGEDQTPGAQKVLPCLNGMGAGLTDLYPNDSEMRRAALRNQIDFAGIAQAYRDEGSSDNFLLSQIGGTTAAVFDTDGAPGQLLALDVPAEEDVRSGRYARSQQAQGAPERSRKVSPILRVYDPASLGARFQKYKEEYLKNPKNFSAAFGSEHGGVAKALESLFESQLASLFLGMIAISKISLSATTNKNGTITDEDITLKRLGVGLRLIVDVGNELGPNAVNASEQAIFDNARQTILNTINWDGKTLATSPAKTLVKAEILKRLGGIGQKNLPRSTTLDQQKASLAFNHAKRGVVAQRDFVYDDTRLIVGQIIGGATEGTRGVVALRK